MLLADSNHRIRDENELLATSRAAEPEPSDNTVVLPDGQRSTLNHLGASIDTTLLSESKKTKPGAPQGKK